MAKYGVDKVSDKNLDWLIEKLYPEKIKRLSDRLEELYTLYPFLKREPNEEVLFLKDKIERLKDKLKVCTEEKKRRKELGIEVGSPAERFIDINRVTATLTGDVTFTSGSTAVTGVGTLFLTEVAAGDYIRPAGGVEWYRVESVVSDTELTLSWAFAQATVTGSAERNAEDGTTPGTAFCHIRQATVDEIRSPGDIIYLRRGQTHTYAGVDIHFDEDGDVNNLITLMGDDGTGWPDETGLAKPIISFGDAARRFDFYDDYFWKISDFELIESDSAYGAARFYHAVMVIEKIDFHDNDPGGRGCTIMGGRNVLVYKCTFYNNLYTNCYVNYSAGLVFKECSFDGGPVTTDRGIWCLENVITLIDTNFGVTTPHDTCDIQIYSWGIVRGRNVRLASPTKVSFPPHHGKESYVRIEDYGGTKLDNRGFYQMGNIIRDTAIVRPEGAPSSARMEPNSFCGLNLPLELCMFSEEFSRWLKAGARSCKMYVRCSGWTVLPTADELYLEVLYYDTVEAKRASVKSTQAVTANDVWAELSVSFSLNSDSPCYANIVLKRYEAGAKVYVDILPIWT